MVHTPIRVVDMLRAGTVCHIGEGALCCRYLAGGPNGLECLKHTSLALELDLRASLGTMVARGDNCEGLQ